MKTRVCPQKAHRVIREMVMKQIMSIHIIKAEVSGAWEREEHARATPPVLTSSPAPGVVLSSGSSHLYDINPI